MISLSAEFPNKLGRGFSRVLLPDKKRKGHFWPPNPPPATATSESVGNFVIPLVS
jgi:hypothetical protein